MYIPYIGKIYTPCLAPSFYLILLSTPTPTKRNFVYIFYPYMLNQYFFFGGGGEGWNIFKIFRILSQNGREGNSFFL